MSGPSMIIRHVTPSDAPAWLEMRSALWPGDDHAAEIRAFFEGRAAEPEAVLLAIGQNEPVAICELAVRTDVPGAENRRTGFVEGLYVVPAHRAGQVARELLRSAQDWARSKDCEAFGSDRDDRFVLDPKFVPVGDQGQA